MRSNNNAPKNCSAHACYVVCLVHTGGKLFEYYLVAFGSWRSHEQWKDICKNLAEDDAYQIPMQQQWDMIAEERTQFHGYVLMGCNSVGNLGKKQMFYTTFIARFHGLLAWALRSWPDMDLPWVEPCTTTCARKSSPKQEKKQGDNSFIRWYPHVRFYSFINH